MCLQEADTSLVEGVEDRQIAIEAAQLALDQAVVAGDAQGASYFTHKHTHTHTHTHTNTHTHTHECSCLGCLLYKNKTQTHTNMPIDTDKHTNARA